MPAQRIVSFQRSNEIRRNHARSLVQQLEVGVLTIGAGLAPDHRAGAVVGACAVQCDGFSVAHHIELLQIGRETVQILVIRSDGMAARSEEVRVPDAEQRQDDRHVGLQRRASEMQIHRVGSVQQGLEIPHADVQRDGQSDGGPE